MRRRPTVLAPLLLAPLLLAPLPLTRTARAAEPGVSLAQESVYSASLGNAAGSRATFECRLSRLAGPEVALTLALPPASRLPQDRGWSARLVAGGAEFTMPLVRLGAAGGVTLHRWAALSAGVLGSVRGFARAVGAGGTLELRDGEGAAEEFPYTLEQGAAVAEVLRRCNPVAVRARQDASELAAVPALIALERNFSRKCREGTGDERSTEDACEERQEYVDRLNALGMCLGRRGEAPAAMAWHRCGPTSFR